MLRNYQNPRNFMRIRTLQSTPKGLPQETQTFSPWIDAQNAMRLCLRCHFLAPLSFNGRRVTQNKRRVCQSCCFLTPLSFNGRRVVQNERRLCQRCRFFDTPLVYFTHRNYDEKQKPRKKPSRTLRCRGWKVGGPLRIHVDLGWKRNIWPSKWKKK